MKIILAAAIALVATTCKAEHQIDFDPTLLPAGIGMPTCVAYIGLQAPGIAYDAVVSGPSGFPLMYHAYWQNDNQVTSPNPINSIDLSFFCNDQMVTFSLPLAPFSTWYIPGPANPPAFPTDFGTTGFECNCSDPDCDGDGNFDELNSTLYVSVDRESIPMTCIGQMECSLRGIGYYTQTELNSIVLYDNPDSLVFRFDISSSCNCSFLVEEFTIGNGIESHVIPTSYQVGFSPSVYYHTMSTPQFSQECTGLLPVADFYVTPETAEIPATVNFMDLSIEGDFPITSWTWDFGDLSTSAVQNPSHTYTVPGVYTVALTITDSIGLSNSYTCDDCIEILNVAPPQNLQIERAIDDMTVSWSPSTHSNIFVYRVFRSTTPEPTQQVAIVSPPDSVYVDANALPNTTYHYRVKNVLWDFSQSEFSSSVSGQRLPQLVLDDSVLSLVATPNTVSPQDSFLVANTGGGQLFYQCEGADTLNSGESVIACSPVADTLNASSQRDTRWVRVLVDGSMLTDGDYTLNVEVRTNDPQSPIDSVSIDLHVNIRPPTAVQNLIPTPYMSSIELSWDPSPDSEEVSLYTVFRGESADLLDTLAVVSSANPHFLDESIVEENLTYFYRVSATDINGSEGTWSEPIATYLDIPAPVYNLEIGSSWPDVELSWSPVDTTVYGNPIQNLTGYLIYFNQFAWDDEYNFYAFVTDTSVVHPFAAQFANMQFYRVAAYAGPISLLNAAIEENPAFKMGTLRKMFVSSKANDLKN